MKHSGLLPRIEKKLLDEEVAGRGLPSPCKSRVRRYYKLNLKCRVVYLAFYIGAFILNRRVSLGLGCD